MAAGMEPTHLLALAFEHANKLHAKQKRKGNGTTPYIAHPMAVAALIMENGGDEEQAAAGLLHDTIEDQHETEENLRLLFGARVARMVVDATHEKIDWKSIPKEQVQEVLRQNRLGIFEHIRHVPLDSLLVIASDKQHNARSIRWDFTNPIKGGIPVLNRFRGKVEGTLWYYREIGQVIASRDGTPGGTFRRIGEEIEEIAARLQAGVDTLTAGG